MNFEVFKKNRWRALLTCFKTDAQNRFICCLNGQKKNVWCKHQTSKDIHHKVMEESIEVQNIIDSPKGKKNIRG
jgi:hypothetical protein